MRSAEETLTLFKESLQKRRAYIRRRLEVLNREEEEYVKANKKGNRGKKPEKYKGRSTLRGGMLMELSTVTCLLKGIESGEWHPDELYNVEDDPTEPC